MRIAFSGGTALYRWAWTEGLESLGQLDATVPLPWEADGARDGEIERLLAAIGDAVEAGGQRFRQGDTFDYGWTTVRFEAGAASGDSAGRLVVSELTEPLLATPATYRRGANGLVALMRAQTEGLRRNGIAGVAAPPHRSDLAVICTRVPPTGPEYPHPLVLERRSEPERGESGWVIRCADPAHDHHNSQALASVRLVHVVAGFPGIVPYLALPAGSAVLVEGQEAIVFRPGEDEGRPDPASALSWTL
ncbi:MAG TPA: hypothetical protein VKQ30_12100 [Ktedonobacterales bacterium]|nr:hypothetical protein [Ktedonobacterales bacterium]